MRVIDATTGAQILPWIGDERATVSEWAAAQACSADLRARDAHYRAIAERLVIVE